MGAAPLWDHILAPSLVRSDSTAVRQELFALLTDAWKLKPAMHPRLRPALLAYLGDGHAELRGEALEFWHRELPKELPGRLKTLLQDSLDCAGPRWVCTCMSHLAYLHISAHVPWSGSLTRLACLSHKHGHPSLVSDWAPDISRSGLL